MSFVERVIVITVTLQARQGLPSRGVPANSNPTFAGTNSNTVRIFGGGGAAGKNGVRIAARVTRPGGVSLGQADVRIYNLPLNLINQLGTLGYPYIYMVGPNTITIEAGNEGSTLHTLFQGTIFSAYADLVGTPESVFNISAQALGLQAAAPAPAASFQGPVDVATVMQGFAAQAGLKFVNNGVTAQLSNPYFSGSLRDQIRAIALHAGIAWAVDDTTNTLIIWPKNGNVTAPGAQIPLIAPPPKGRMIGYPTYTEQGLRLKTEYTATIGYGTQVRVESSLQQANGIWTVFYLDYDLECQAENGPWFTNLEVAAPGYPILPPTSLT